MVVAGPVEVSLAFSGGSLESRYILDAMDLDFVPW